MSQFKIKGIDYPDESLQHGLGKGSGRGRPVGSKNGQVMPGAAYMKDYKIVGQKAVGDTNIPGAQNTTRTSSGTNKLKTYGSGSNSRLAGGVTRRASSGTTAPRTQSTRVVSTTNATRTPSTRVVSTTQTSTPAQNVERGKQAVEKVLGGSTTSLTANTQSANASTGNQAAQRNRDMSTAELRATDPVGDWPWSARRVEAAGGLDSREGRQIVYDNPTLNEDYKKHIAKLHGDSDGKSYPKYLEEGNKATTVQTTSTEQQNATQNQTGTNNSLVNELVRNAPDNMSVNRQRIDNDLQNRGRNGPINPNLPGADVGTINRPLQNQTTSTKQQNTAKNQLNQQVQDVLGKDVRNQPGYGTPAQPTAQPAQSQETPEQKSFWDQVGGWFSQAGKDIADTAVGAWNTASGAVSTAANWVGEKLGAAGDWAQTAAKDVGDWVGARGKEFGDWLGTSTGDVGRAVNDWWNGRDVYQQVADPNHPGVTRDVQSHEAGARENIGNALNSVGTWIGNTAGDVGRWLDEGWNGREREIRRPGENGNVVREKVREGGLRSDIENGLNGLAGAAGDVWNGVTGAVSNAGQWIGSTAQAAGDVANNAINAGRGFLNDAGQWIGDTAQNVSNYFTTAPASRRAEQAGVVPSEIERQNELLNNGTISPETYNNNMNSLIGIQNADRAAAQAGWDGVPADVREMNERENNNLWQNIGNFANDNIVTPIANGAGDLVRDAGNLLNNAGQTVVNGAQNLWNGISNGAQDLWNGISNGAQNTWNDVRNAAQNAGETLSLTPEAASGSARAIAAGVPEDIVHRINSNLMSGQITPEQYQEIIDRQILEAGRPNDNGGNTVTKVTNGISGAANDLWNGISNGAQNLWNDVQGTANNVAQWTGEAANNVTEGIRHTPGITGRFVTDNMPDGSTHTTYVPSIGEEMAAARGEVPSYVEKYYDKSNPDREAYWGPTYRYLYTHVPAESVKNGVWDAIPAALNPSNPVYEFNWKNVNPLNR